MGLDSINTQSLDELLDSDEFKDEVDSYKYENTLVEGVNEEDLREHQLSLR